MSNNSILIVFAGPNGVGKTTYAEEFCKRFDLDFINPDTLKANNQLDKGKIFLQILHTKLNAGDSFGFETTLSGKWLSSFLKQAKNKHYKMVCFYIFIYPLEILKYRIEERIRKRGHFVDFKIVKRRYKRSLKNFWYLYRTFFDKWELIDNTENFKSIAKGARNIFEVEDEFIFKKFIELVEE